MGIRFKKISEDDLELLMKWRMRTDITRYLLTDPKLTMEEQKKWLKKINSDNLRYDWIICVDDIPVGYTNIIDIDNISRKCMGGLYIANKKYASIKLYMDVNNAFFNFIFNVLHLHRYTIQAFEENPTVNLFRVLKAKYECTMIDYIYKYGKYHNVVQYSLYDDMYNNLWNKDKYEKVEIEL